MGKKAILFAWLALLGGAGCNVNNPTYYPPPMGPLEVGVMDAMGMTIGSATAAVTLPFRSPDADESAGLAADSQRLGFQAPWLRRDREAISIQYAITNLDDRAGRAQIQVNGANEFTSYDPAALTAAAMAAAMNQQQQQQANYLPLIQPKPEILQPHQTVTGIIREDDFAEAELDLDAIGRWSANPPAVLINASEVNPVGLEQVPSGLIVPALFQVMVTFTADAHMKLDFLVRVRDQKNLLEGAGAAFAPTPQAYTPPPPMMMN